MNSKYLVGSNEISLFQLIWLFTCIVRSLFRPFSFSQLFHSPVVTRAASLYTLSNLFNRNRAQSSLAGDNVSLLTQMYHPLHFLAESYCLTCRQLSDISAKRADKNALMCCANRHCKLYYIDTVVIEVTFERNNNLGKIIT